MPATIPVILDTDIGSDVDDTWALIMMLRSPELDVRLITTCSGNAAFRVRYVARLLEIAGRTDIPIGVGKPIAGTEHDATTQHEWVDHYDLDAYRGVIHQDGPQAIVEVIRGSDAPVTVVAIGPLTTVAEALRRDPGIMDHSRFVGMHGSIYQGYDGSPRISAEANVRHYCSDCREVFASDWDKTITPLDTCGHVVLDGEDYRRVLNSDDPLVRALVENCECFARNVRWLKDYDVRVRSSTLFDTVAVYLAFSEDLLAMRRLPIVVTEDGYTRVDPAGRPVNCAIAWKDLDAFKKLLLERLLTNPPI